MNISFITPTVTTSILNTTISTLSTSHFILNNNNKNNKNDDETSSIPAIINKTDINLNNSKTNIQRSSQKPYSRSLTFNGNKYRTTTTSLTTITHPNIYISIVLKCCLERLLLDKELAGISSIEEMLELFKPCQHLHHLNDPNIYLRDIFYFYTNFAHPGSDVVSTSDHHSATISNCSKTFYNFFCKNVKISKWRKFFIAILVMTLIIGVFGNSLVCIVIYLSSTLKKRVTNYFLLSLAVGDLLCTLLVLPVKIATSSKADRFCMSREVCYIYMTFEPIAFVASITHLFVICIDRFVAIGYPYRYYSLFCMRNIKITIASIWCYALTWGVLHHINWGAFQMGGTFSISNDYKCHRILDKFPAYLYMVVFVVPCVIMGVLYGRIWYIALLHDREIRKHRHITTNLIEQTTLHHRTAVLNTRKSIITSQVLELRATKVIVVVLGTYIVCWAPLVFMIIVDTLITKIELDRTPVIIVCEYFPILNSVLNPFIYCLLHNDFQKGLKKVLLERIPCVATLKMMKGRRNFESQSETIDIAAEDVCENIVSVL